MTFPSGVRIFTDTLYVSRCLVILTAEFSVVSMDCVVSICLLTLPRIMCRSGVPGFMIPFIFPEANINDRCPRCRGSGAWGVGLSLGFSGYSGFSMLACALIIISITASRDSLLARNSLTGVVGGSVSGCVLGFIQSRRVIVAGAGCGLSGFLFPIIKICLNSG